MENILTLEQYFKTWMNTYKEPVVAQATYMKYLNTLKQIRKYFGEISISKITATTYQQALNKYSKTHSKLTVSCFHKQIHACLLDAVDEQIIEIDPARKAIIFGRRYEKTKVKCLNYEEWKVLLTATYNTTSKLHFEVIKVLLEPVFYDLGFS